jgi:flagellar motor component MotA
MMDTKQVKKIADKEVKAHEQRMHPGAKRWRAGGKTNSAHA